MGKQMTNREIEHDLGQLIQITERHDKHIDQLIQRMKAVERRCVDISDTPYVLAGLAAGLGVCLIVIMVFVRLFT